MEKILLGYIVISLLLLSYYIPTLKHIVFMKKFDVLTNPFLAKTVLTSSDFLVELYKFLTCACLNRNYQA